MIRTKAKNIIFIQAITEGMLLYEQTKCSHFKIFLFVKRIESTKSERKHKKLFNPHIISFNFQIKIHKIANEKYKKRKEKLY